MHAHRASQHPHKNPRRHAAVRTAPSLSICTGPVSSPPEIWPPHQYESPCNTTADLERRLLKLANANNWMYLLRLKLLVTRPELRKLDLGLFLDMQLHFLSEVSAMKRFGRWWLRQRTKFLKGRGTDAQCDIAIAIDDLRTQGKCSGKVARPDLIHTSPPIVKGSDQFDGPGLVCHHCGQQFPSDQLTKRALLKMKINAPSYACINCISIHVTMCKKEKADGYLNKRLAKTKIEEDLKCQARKTVDMEAMLEELNVPIHTIGPTCIEQIELCKPMTLVTYRLPVCANPEDPIDGASLSPLAFLDCHWPEKRASNHGRVLNLENEQDGTEILVLLHAFSKSETEHIVMQMKGPRAGAASGYTLPGVESSQLSKCTKKGCVIFPLVQSPGGGVIYHGSHGRPVCFNGVYPKMDMRRMNKNQREQEINGDRSQQDVILSEMICRIRSICVAYKYVSQKRYRSALQTWKKTLRRAIKWQSKRRDGCKQKGWFHDMMEKFVSIQGHSILGASLLIVAGTTGAMKNHQATAVHKDGNTSHVVETLAYYSRIKVNEMECPSNFPNSEPFAYMFLPDYCAALALRPCLHLMNCSLKSIRHVADYSRNHLNWSCAYGPK
ncbi:unnamed protein product [Cylindrotheca closterium]|uniref:Uncharacterized protein n=1 Tax=Cylindrotheca closterium TaxID=2856 RepID=A0AAD2FUZ5_9STRA|nr:unnamed protein product [Cylindrotheca closterium]